MLLGLPSGFGLGVSRIDGILGRDSIRTIRNQHPVYKYLSYHQLSPSYYSFMSTLSNVPISKVVSKGLEHPCWRDAMIEEMTALHANNTWELVRLPKGKFTVGSI